MKYIPTMKLNR